MELMTTTEAAEALGKDVRTIHRMVTAGRLRPAHKAPGLRGSYVFTAADVRALLVADAERRSP